MYLFIDGYCLTSGLPSITGQPLTADQRRDYAANVPALVSPDVQTGGWAIVMNIGNGMGPRMVWVYHSKKRGILPTLTRLHQDWAGFVYISSSSLGTADGMSYVAVRILADKVGLGPLLEVLRRTAGGQDFESAMSAVTGYTVAQLDAQRSPRGSPTSPLPTRW